MKYIICFLLCVGTYHVMFAQTDQHERDKEKAIKHLWSGNIVKLVPLDRDSLLICPDSPSVPYSSCGILRTIIVSPGGIDQIHARITLQTARMKPETLGFRIRLGNMYFTLHYLNKSGEKLWDILKALYRETQTTRL